MSFNVTQSPIPDFIFIPTETGDYLNAQIPSCTDHQWIKTADATLEWQALLSVIQVAFCCAQKWRLLATLSLTKIARTWPIFTSEAPKNIESLTRSFSALQLSAEQLNKTEDCSAGSSRVYEAHVSVSDPIDKGWYQNCIQPLAKGLLFKTFSPSSLNNTSILPIGETRNFSISNFESQGVNGRKWSVALIDVSTEKGNCLFTEMKEAIEMCEKQELSHQKEILVGLALGGYIVVCAGAGVCLARCQRKHAEVQETRVPPPPAKEKDSYVVKVV